MTKQEAELAGASRYTGTPCGKCNGTERYTISGHCVPCLKARPRKQYPKKNYYKRKRAQMYLFKHCEHCGAEFRTFPSRVSRGWGKFCSRPCAMISRNDRSRANEPSAPQA